MAENNEKKRIGRRVTIGGAAIVLVTIAFYVIIFNFKHDAELLKIGINLYGNYTAIILGVVGFIISGLSGTDIFGKKAR